MSDLIKKALQAENDERERGQVHRAQEIIRSIQRCREQRDGLALEITKLQTELRELQMPEMLADNVLGT
uniref:Uncharacterized protein n=1 Tax=viral metagenome TaxID=1070528 RepID=A0A6H1ZL50_9ZZZZ